MDILQAAREAKIVTQEPLRRVDTLLPIYDLRNSPLFIQADLAKDNAGNIVSPEEAVEESFLFATAPDVLPLIRRANDKLLRILVKLANAELLLRNTILGPRIELCHVAYLLV
jgi:hypothetical protein